MSLQVAMLSTYPPTQCGIATFAKSLSDAMAAAGHDVNIVSVGSRGRPQPNPVVVAEHRGSQDLPRTASVLNSHDAVVVQHEFGIYPGADGEGILDILGQVHVPVVSVMHTVIEQPSERQRRITQALLNASDATVVMSKSALRSLLRAFDVDMKRMHVIPHGAPDMGVIARAGAVRMRPRLLTWGLLGPGKGIEWVIEAMSYLRDLDPAPEYFVVGQTHPNVVRRDGYQYRDALASMARKLRVDDRVRFIDGYLDKSALIRLVTSADMYVLPYDARDQVTSGVLVEAMVAGGPVIATRFPHASELLGDGTGALVEHGNPMSMAQAIRRLIEDPTLRARMRELTLQKAQAFLWSSVGHRFSQLTLDVLHARKPIHGASRPVIAEQVPA
jgi:polysaccharide biosynthesis protein PslF